MATGPWGPEFLWLAARVGATGNVDSAGELRQLAQLAGRHGPGRTRSPARLSGFESDTSYDGAGTRMLSRGSRFRTPVAAAEDLWSALERHQGTVELGVPACHLDTTGWRSRHHSAHRTGRGPVGAGRLLWQRRPSDPGRPRVGGSGQVDAVGLATSLIEELRHRARYLPRLRAHR